MVIHPQLYVAKVMHKRLFPKKNLFWYGLYYLVLPLPAKTIPGRLISFCPKDVGYRDGSDPTSWARNILASHGLNEKIKKIVLITMPRVLGYVFNPVSFYLCFDHEGHLLTVLCEVHNTFGEQHTYVCSHDDQRPLDGEEWLEADKVFHVSPFLERAGTYKFRFSLKDNHLGIWIDYFDEENRKQLITSLVGKLTPITRETIRQNFWRHPLVAFKAILMIHWQALMLLKKGIQYISKPKQLGVKITTSRKKNVNK
ncbi:MAG: DUF1365 domain-containing protein [Alphaproteobacteria bacterium]|jgi:DUF1365 family protein